MPYTTSAPTLKTPRLTLRAHTARDFDASYEMWIDPKITRFIGGRAATRDEAWTKILRYAGMWHLMGFGYWLIEETATKRFVGDIGFADFKRDLTLSIEGQPETGWALAAWAHGKGMASEALAGILAWGDANLSQPSVCIISPENPASLRVAQKCGYKEVTRTTFKDDPVILFRR